VANDEEIAAPIERVRQKEAENDDIGSPVPAIKYASSVVPDIAKISPTGKYKINDLQEWSSKTNAEKFYDPEYNETLNGLIEAVVTTESPVLETTLIQRISRVHGFNRAGRLIRERVMDVVDKHYHIATDHYGENFVWLSAGQRADWNSYRLPATENDIRQVDAIPSEELCALALDTSGENKIAEMAKSLGIKRLTTQARQKLESLL